MLWRMSQPPFIHLRVHSAYSLLEGAIRLKDLPKLCQAHGMPAVALTDTNNLFGGLEFATVMAAAGIQPIIGCQLDLLSDADEANGGRRGPSNGNGNGAAPLVFLVQSEAGYRNLLALLADAHGGELGTTGVTVRQVCDRAAGLILLTGGAEGAVGRLIRANKRALARDLLVKLQQAYGDRLYVEIQRHGLESEAETEPAFLEQAEELALPIVATNEAFFADPEMYEAHDALLCIAEGVAVAEPERRRVTQEHAFKGPAEMAALFGDLPDAIENTHHIARRCGFLLENAKPILPRFADGGEAAEQALLREMAAEGLEIRLRDQVHTRLETIEDRAATDREYRERLAFELDVICEMGFAGYFLIVSEFIQWAKGQGIPVGPGRGSGAASVVAWSLKITDLDPIRFGLLFERFLNPERVSMPDFDIDFCQDRRDEVIAHVQERYGRDQVAQIITFGKLQARAVLRDVGRVLGMAYGHVDRICKLVPNNPANPVTLAQAIEGEPQLQAMIAEDETVARLVAIAKQLEGLYRHASTHAAGVVIGDRPLQERIPLHRDPRSAALLTGFNMKWVESAGLVKFDFLGLKTLTVLERAVELVRAGDGVDLDLAKLPFDDAKTFDMLSRADTVGVFQLESAGMRDALRKLKPDTFEDIIAVVALYRPGPMDNIPSYINRKHGQEEVDYLYPTLEPILRETHGIMIYQEQVMQIAQVLSGYSLGGADLLRRAMGKKIKQEMDQQREIFVEGAVARGVHNVQAAHIFDLVNKFAGYGFNKAHAAAYALIAYQTAYIKANYPVAFCAASMMLDIHATDKLNGFRQELDRLGIPLLPPDVNKSGVSFTVERMEDGAHAIRFALAAIKNVGEGAVAAMVAERDRGGPFKDLTDFAGRVDAHALNKRQLEHLARAGAFDGFTDNRRFVLENVETLLRHAQAAAERRASGQVDLFAGGGAGEPPPPLRLREVDDWPALERLKEELDAIGFYLSAHPLDGYEKQLKRLRVTPYAELVARRMEGQVTLAGTVVAKRLRTSAKGNRYAFVQLSDASALYEITVFSEVLAALGDGLEAGNSFVIEAAAQFEAESPRLTAASMVPLEEKARQIEQHLEVRVQSADGLARMHDLVAAMRPGRGRITVVPDLTADLGPSLEVEIRIAEGRALDLALAAELRRLPGVVAVTEL